PARERPAELIGVLGRVAGPPERRQKEQVERDHDRDSRMVTTPSRTESRSRSDRASAARVRAADDRDACGPQARRRAGGEQEPEDAYRIGDVDRPVAVHIEELQLAGAGIPGTPALARQLLRNGEEEVGQEPRGIGDVKPRILRAIAGELAATGLG